MKLMTLSVSAMSGMLLKRGDSPQAPAIGVDGDVLGRQLVEVRAHGLPSRGRQPRLETIIDGIGDRLHGAMSSLERADDLPLAIAPMIEMRPDDDGWIVNGSAVGGKQPPWLEFHDACERAEILRQIAAAARLDDDAAAGNHQVSREQHSRGGVPQRNVIGGM